MLPRVLAFAALLAACVLPARAEVPQVAQLMRGPVVHRPTGLVFPENLAGIRLTRVTNYADHGQPALGFSYHYDVPGRLVYSIYLYGEVLRPPPGPDSPQAIRQFDDGVAAIRAVAQMGRYRDLKMPDRPAQCRYGTFVFRCITSSAVLAQDNRSVWTRLMVTGYRNSILKIRIDWTQASGVAAEEVDRTTQTLLGAILK